MHEDMNIYDGEHAATNHPKMSKEEWEADLSDRVDDLLYARAHRNDPAARGGNQLQQVAACEPRVLVLHVGSGGKRPPSARRRASPEVPARSPSRDADRDRSGRSIRNSPGASPRTRSASCARCFGSREPAAHLQDASIATYTDQALTPVTDDETETLELFTHSEAARQSVKHAQKIAQLTGSANAA